MSKRFFLLTLVIAVTALTVSCVIVPAIPVSTGSPIENDSEEDIYNMTVSANVDTLRAHFLEWINKFREVHDKPPLVYNDKLNKMAEMWAEVHRAEGLHMTHEHSGSFPEKRANQIGYSYKHLSENVARAQIPDGKQIFEGWRDSEGHRENMLGPVTQLGLACIHTPYGVVDTAEYVCVAVHGSPLP